MPLWRGKQSITKSPPDEFLSALPITQLSMNGVAVMHNHDQSFLNQVARVAMRVADAA